MGVALLAAMSYGTHDVGLTARFIDGIAHGLAVDGEAFVGLAVDGIPALQGAVEVLGVDADEHIANDRFAGDRIAVVAVAATEPGPSLLAEVFAPLGDGLVAAHPA